MSRKKKPLPLIENVQIEACAAEGKSLFHWNDLVVFVPFCVPGDVVDVQIRRKKHSFAEGEVLRFVQYSKVRAQARCRHFGICGGCKWQNLPYAEQLGMKQQQVFDQLTRIGHLQLPAPGTAADGVEFRPIMGSQQLYEYRNKLDFGASNRRWLTKEEIASAPNPSLEGEPGQSLKDIPALGFHITGAFDKILPIEQCHLMHPLHNEIRNDIRDFAVANGISFFDLRQQTGLLRDVIIRNSNTGEWMVIIQFHFDDEDSPRQAEELLRHVAARFPEITSLFYLDNQKCNDTITDQDLILFKGNDHIFEQMEDLRFKVGPKSFYQTNTLQAYHLYSVVRQLAAPEGATNAAPPSAPEGDTNAAPPSSPEGDTNAAPLSSPEGDTNAAPPSSPEGDTNVPAPNTIEAPSGAVGGASGAVGGASGAVGGASAAVGSLVYDLYTGTGTIANFVARQARQVIGIEYVPEAIEDAKVNSQINHIDNTLFFAGDMKDILNDEFIARHGRPDIIITDPPRAGMHPDVVQTILRAAPARIVYVSCNPATQARDLQLLCHDYAVRVVQPVDMFPHTPHVENVVMLERKS